MHKICVAWHQTELVSLSGLVRLHRTTVVRSSVIFGNPLLDSTTTPSVHPCSAGMRRATRGETPSTASADQTSPTSLGPSTPRGNGICFFFGGLDENTQIPWHRTSWNQAHGDLSLRYPAQAWIAWHIATRKVGKHCRSIQLLAKDSEVNRDSMQFQASYGLKCLTDFEVLILFAW